MSTEKRKWRIYRVKCVVCEKDCAASLRGSKGDWTECYPRRHKLNGVFCEGMLKIAPFIEDKKSFHPDIESSKDKE